MMTPQQLYLSAVLDKRLTNTQGQLLGKVCDLTITPDEEFPIVNQVLVRRGKATYAVEWSKVVLFNPAVISVASSESELTSYRETPGEIRVKRDILDKQIVDVNGAKVVRVNDLKLGRHKNSLCLFSVDVGFRGLLRRMGYERVWSLVQRDIPEREIGWQFVGHLEPNAARLTLTMARENMAEMHPADLAHIISRVPRQNVHTVLNSLDDETAGEAIHELEPELRTRIITELDSERASDILEEMSPDEAADVLGDLPVEKAEELLGLMEPEDAEEIQELLVHEEDCAGGMMNNDFISIPAGLTVGQALKEVRLQAPEVDSVYYAYILDKNEHPLGVVSLKELLIQDEVCPVAEVMTENLKTVPVDAEPEEILEVIAKYNLVAVPVLDEHKKMAGIVTVDDILERFLPLALKHKRHPAY
ncbi:magnesium transporter [Geomesophilobacter sediminis]|uniref:Magnesium transporter n=1 Tax=Geomesophilobacter sediminis TaxID=2798584 RepID=A0A8J7JGK1_9BACT|nr:CBS domain-containing protein [Geomesophilobacter sediminis]MBJ6723630.1 magnesium transporter [Geomesophilobacter sediminis]